MLPDSRRLLTVLALFLAPWSNRCLADPIDTLAVTDEIRGKDGAFGLASIDAARRILYVAREDGVMRIDLATRQTTPAFIPGDKVQGVVSLPDDRILSTNSGNDTITLANARTGAVLTTLPAGKHPQAIIHDPASGLVFVTNEEDGTVTAIDPVALTVSSIPVGGTLRSAAIDGTGYLYVAIKDAGQIAVVDIARRKLVSRYPLPGCDSPAGLAFDPENRMLLVACKNQKAVAVRAADGGIIGAFEIDRVPNAVIFDPNRRIFFIPCARDATMTAIASNDGHPALLRKIPTAIGARTGALDPVSGDLYLPAADYSIGLTGISQKAGTFRVLVVGARPVERP